MTVIKRISRLITANIHHLLDQAEDPEVMARQLIRDLEESITELRRETVRAVTRQKQLQKQVAVTDNLIRELEAKALRALQQDQETLARQILARKLQTQKMQEALVQELEAAALFAEQLKGSLARLQSQAQETQRHREEFIRRRHLTESRQRLQEATRLSDTFSNVLHADEDTLAQLEAQAEAAQEMLEMEIRKELELQKLTEEYAVEKELQRLKESK